MILREIRKNFRGERDSRRFFIPDGMRGNFHGDERNALLSHIRKRFLQEYGIGRGELRGDSRSAVGNTRGADNARFFARRFENGSEKICNGGFAVGARYPRHAHFFCGIAVKRARGERNGFPCVFHENLRRRIFRTRKIHRRFGDDCRGALSRGFRRTIATVRAAAAESEKRFSSSDIPTVVRNARNFRFRRFFFAASAFCRVHGYAVYAFNQFRQPHRNSLRRFFRVVFRAILFYSVRV